MSRTYVLLGAVFLFSLAIVVQLVRLQFLQRGKWKEIAQKEQILEREIEAQRGNILADDGSMLATSVARYRCSIDPWVVDLDTTVAADRDTLIALCDSLSSVFNNEENQYPSWVFYNRIANGLKRAKRDTLMHMYVLNQELSYQQYRRVSTWPLLRNHPMNGGLLGERQVNRRTEPFKPLASFTLGRWDSAGVPVKGLENWFDEELRGADGTMLVRKIVGQYEQPLYDFGEDPARDGSDIVTTLNVKMQDIVSTALDSALRKHEAKYGTVILMETATGHVKAVANLGRYGDQCVESFNYAISRRIEPGSTIKLASAIIALEDRAIGLTDTIDTGLGFRQYYDRTMKDHIAMGKIDIYRAFDESSNVFFSSVIFDHYRENPDRYIDWIERLGLTQTVAPQVKGEPKPFLLEPGTSAWDPTSLPWMAIGYNMRLTPLQICAFYNGVANNGKVMAPLFVTEVRDGAEVIKSYEPKVINQRITHPWVLKEVKKMMELVVEQGTARQIKTSKYKIAGKTGTAKKVKNGIYVKDYQASFAGYFPADRPKYTMYVLVDEPSKGEFYGGNVAAPIFREISDKIVALDPELGERFPQRGTEAQAAQEPMTRIIYKENARKVYEDLGIDMPDELPAGWVKTKRENGKLSFTEIEVNKGKIPYVVGMTARDALNIMEYVGQKVELNGHGKVVKQPLPVGSMVKADNIVLELN